MWIVVAYAGRRSKAAMWECRCDCGKTSIVNGSSLAAGISAGCGCVRNARTAERNRAGTTHGMGMNCPTYRSWIAMRYRCTNPTDKDFPRYGGRGIKVCERWLNSFENFLEDMGLRPTGTTIDRKDTNGDYTPENCRWATDQQQQRNRRDTRNLTFQGRTQCMSAWADERGLEKCTLWQRIVKKGWSVERALTTPARAWNRRVP